MSSDTSEESFCFLLDVNKSGSLGVSFPLVGRKTNAITLSHHIWSKVNHYPKHSLMVLKPPNLPPKRWKLEGYTINNFPGTIAQIGTHTGQTRMYKYLNFEVTMSTASLVVLRHTRMQQFQTGQLTPSTPGEDKIQLCCRPVSDVRLLLQESSPPILQIHKTWKMRTFVVLKDMWGWRREGGFVKVLN